MSFKVLRFQDTPNPNAVKCVLDRKVTEKTRSFFSAAEASDDPLAAALFGIPGVTNILMNGDWITVSKDPKSAWKSIKAGVEKVLGEAP